MSTEVPCYICRHPVDVSDEKNFEFTMEDGKPKYILHKGCAERSANIFSAEDKSEELFSLQKQFNDLQIAYRELDEGIQSSVNIDPLVTYLEELLENLRLSSKRAPQGSMENRINAFRSNDTEDILQRIHALKAKKGTHKE